MENKLVYEELQHIYIYISSRPSCARKEVIASMLIPGTSRHITSRGGELAEGEK